MSKMGQWVQEQQEAEEQNEFKTKGKQNEHINSSTRGEWQRKDGQLTQHEPSGNALDSGSQEAPAIPL